MADQRAAVVVFNPAAGRRGAHEALRAVTTRLDGKIAAVLETSLAGGFDLRLRDAIRDVVSTGTRPKVIGVGGDGTLSIALNALADPSAVTMAVVPVGSGNDFAAALGVATVDKAIDAIERGTSRLVDFGVVNGRRFANCVGIGLDAEIGALSARMRRRGFPPGPSYYAAALVGLFMVKQVGIALRSADKTIRREDGVMVTIGNGPEYGGGFKGAPGALLDDGLLDVNVFSDVQGLFRRLALMQRIRAGLHVGQSNVDTFRTATLEIDVDREVAMHVDGEIASVRHASIAIVPNGMRAIAP
ncbi:MAG TPA: YegS/Rv2252/BmrU family lipid kinase [Candidatus Eremiobacteraceae bacterium]|nr:YegS/Rv2252/BmrU family lipid kinase [Candidatus Eremiobacteraceae bacterium]